jgi:hypothetical protein
MDGKRIDTDFFVPEDYIPSQERSELANWLERNRDVFKPVEYKQPLHEYIFEQYFNHILIGGSILALLAYGKVALHL